MLTGGDYSVLDAGRVLDSRTTPTARRWCAFGHPTDGSRHGPPVATWNRMFMIRQRRLIDACIWGWDMLGYCIVDSYIRLYIYICVCVYSAGRRANVFIFFGDSICLTNAVPGNRSIVAQVDTWLCRTQMDYHPEAARGIRCVKSDRFTKRINKDTIAKLEYLDVRAHHFPWKTKLQKCSFFSVLQFIPQGWQPAWTLSGFLLALLTLLCAGDMVKWGGCGDGMVLDGWIHRCANVDTVHSIHPTWHGSAYWWHGVQDVQARDLQRCGAYYATVFSQIAL